VSVDLSSQNTQDLFDRWCLGNKEAVALLNLFCRWAREVDDHIDEDNDKQRGISTILELSLIHIAGNKFYQDNSIALSVVVLEMLVYWRLGDKFKQPHDEKKAIFGFVYRESTDRLAVAIAGILGGAEFAYQVAQEVYEHTQATSDETVSDWLKGK
jgi:hypothetical protein